MKHMNLRQFVITSLFVALTLVLGFTPLGIIPLGFINVTILHIPVIIGTILLGWRTGLLLGFFFGLTSTLRAFSIPTPASALVSTLMSASPVFVVIMSMLPRLLVPVVSHLVYRLMFAARTDNAALTISAVAGTLTNTIFYLGLMLLFYHLAGLDTAAILTLITGTGIIAGGTEAIAAAVLTTPVISALKRVKTNA